MVNKNLKTGSQGTFTNKESKRRGPFVISNKPWINEIFQMFDCNSDNEISLRELIIGCAPDVDNDKNIDSKEFGYGKTTAICWLSNILCVVPDALNDNNMINFVELQKAENCPDPKPTNEHNKKAEKLINNVNFN